MPRNLVLGLALGLLGLSAACESTDRTDDANGSTDSATDVGDAGDTNGTDPGSDSETGSSTTTSDGSGCTAMDILFVVDDSGSMAEEQGNLATNFPNFVSVLDNYVTPGGTSLKYRLGVTTTGVIRTFKQKLPPPFPTTNTSTTGPDGKLLGQNDCSLGANPWVESTDADVTGKFSCMAVRGTSGSGTEMPLAAIEAAFIEHMVPGGANEGFYEPNDESLLVIVVLTDEDDCSIEPGGTMVTSLAGSSDCDETKSIGLYDPAEMRDLVLDVAGGEGRVVVVGIAGATQGGCSSSFGDAIYAEHLKTFVQGFGEHGLFGDICAGDLSTTLQDALEIMQVSCEELPQVE